MFAAVEQRELKAVVVSDAAVLGKRYFRPVRIFCIHDEDAAALIPGRLTTGFIEVKQQGRVGDLVEDSCLEVYGRISQRELCSQRSQMSCCRRSDPYSECKRGHGRKNGEDENGAENPP